MNIRSFLSGDGQVQYEDTFVSAAIIRQALQKKYTVRVLEEKPKYLRYKVVRLARLYGVFFFLHPILEIFIKHENNRVRVSWAFTWLDHYLVLFIAITAFISRGLAPFSDETLGETITGAFIFSFLLLSVFGLLIFLDTRLFSWRVKRILKRLGK